MAMPGIRKPDILQTVQGAGVDLRQRGRLWWALCPFHHEQTPSFAVDAEKQRWKCFGECGTGGDILDFVMKFKGISFKEAMRLLNIPGGLRGGSKQAKIDPQKERKRALSEAFNRWVSSAVRDLCDEIWLMNVIDSCVEKPSDLEIPGLGSVYLDRNIAGHELSVLMGDDLPAKVALYRKGALCHTN